MPSVDTKSPHLIVLWLEKKAFKKLTIQIAKKNQLSHTLEEHVTTDLPLPRAPGQTYGLFLYIYFFIFFLIQVKTSTEEL